MPDYKGKSISGRVITARKVDKSTGSKTWEWGWYVCVELDAGQTPDAVNYLYFCHNARNLVSVGQRVKSGDALAVISLLSQNSIPTSFIALSLSPRVADRAAYFYLILYRFASLKECILWFKYIIVRIFPICIFNRLQRLIITICINLNNCFMDFLDSNFEFHNLSSFLPVWSVGQPVIYSSGTAFKSQSQGLHFVWVMW